MVLWPILARLSRHVVAGVTRPLVGSDVRSKPAKLPLPRTDSWLRTVQQAGDKLDLLRFVYTLLLAISFGADGAESVGSQACASCHVAIYRSFMQTQMAQSSGRVGTQEP